MQKARNDIFSSYIFTAGTYLFWIRLYINRKIIKKFFKRAIFPLILPYIWLVVFITTFVRSTGRPPSLLFHNIIVLHTRVTMTAIDMCNLNSAAIHLLRALLYVSIQ